MSKNLENVIRVAEDIARTYERDYVGTEHLLLGVARQEDSTGGQFLANRGLTSSRIRKEVDKLATRSLEDTWVFGRLPGTPHFRNVMAHAIEEARAAKSKVVCTHHLLLGLMAEKGSVASAAMTNLGITPVEIRDQAAELGLAEQ